MAEVRPDRDAGVGEGGRADGPLDHVGPYQVLERAGEGPFGVVFRAEGRAPGDAVVSASPHAHDRGPDARPEPGGAGAYPVALKLIREEADRGRVAARFEAARPALEALDHPNIARWIDFGTRPSGQPYFVSEWVAGPTLTRHCDERRLSIRDRVALLLPACRAVEAAHRLGLVHGGLRPSNVRVAGGDDDATPKLLDLAASAALRGEPPAIEDPAGRVEYLSPEQADPGRPAPETRDDVYGLGAILYELLAGSAPLPRERVRGVPWPSALRLVRGEVPPPSRRLEESRDELGRIAADRRETPGGLLKAVRGDLDCVAMKALARDRDGRYESAAALARDLQLYLDHRPPEACPPGAARGAWVAARSHALAALTLAGLLLVLLALAVGGSALALRESREKSREAGARKQAEAKREDAEKAEADLKSRLNQAEALRRNAARERDRALAEAEAARRAEGETHSVLDYLRARMLSAGRPGDDSLPAAFWAQGEGKDVTLLKAADAAAGPVSEVFADHPLAEADVREVLGLTYLNCGAPDKAVAQYERALALREAIQGDGSAGTAACRNQLAVAYRLAGKADEASRLFEHHPNSQGHAASLAARGATLLLEGKPADAELKLRECLTLRKRIEPDAWTTFEAESMLGEALAAQKKYAEAEPLLVSGYQGLKSREEAIPAVDRPRLARALDRLITLYEAWGKDDQAARWREEREAAPAS
jgi:serine/threonine protein kinase